MANAIPATFVLLNFSLNKASPEITENITTNTFATGHINALYAPG